MTIIDKYNYCLKFDTSVKSLLCIPVINSENQTVAILFTINKIQNGPSSSSFFDGFSRQDVNVAQVEF